MTSLEQESGYPTISGGGPSVDGVTGSLPGLAPAADVGDELLNSGSEAIELTLRRTMSGPTLSSGSSTQVSSDSLTLMIESYDSIYKSTESLLGLLPKENIGVAAADDDDDDDVDDEYEEGSDNDFDHPPSLATRFAKLTKPNDLQQVLLTPNYDRNGFRLSFLQPLLELNDEIIKEVEET